ncbi:MULTISPECIES: response regulator transcription factor [Methylosinus]|uniref:DNA-binding response regulator n=1 Tax=Methylosinus trichosporium (strain ATCC 35070 / NCIMB 11131 / UNIQEM 75 / OB3b) TaxID=595536 RepID=A0A2D2D0Z0_METT3|nr:MULTISPECIES: response regulator [Methylosinus]ATQ68539.1 DNA-binding response regulator [Methylosinus trichosporium OB3b]OBS52805.1 DNA-binding response regulator [Methylosinus sp. 3S-1]
MTDAAIVHIVDDDPAVRDSLRLLLLTEDIEARAHAGVRDFFAVVAPDETGCVVTDVRMPEASGFDLLAEMKARRLSLPVIVITAHADVPLAVRAMKAGALDLLEKPFDDEALLGAVRRALARHGKPTAEAVAARERLATLTMREREVLEGILGGRSNKIIAFEIGASVRTVEAHRAHLMAKMRAANLSDLVRMSLLAQRSEPC